MADEWTGYWGAVAGVGATLLGLAFVTFQLRAREWRATPARHLTAVFTLCELAAPVIISLTSLWPGHPWRQSTLIVAALAAVLLLVYRLKVRAEPGKDDFSARHARLSWITVCVIMVLVVGALVSEQAGLKIVASGMLWLLVSGASESWLFLEPAGFGEPPTGTESDS
jgi:hypothetical protein